MATGINVVRKVRTSSNAWMVWYSKDGKPGTQMCPGTLKDDDEISSFLGRLGSSDRGSGKTAPEGEGSNDTGKASKEKKDGKSGAPLLDENTGPAKT